MDGTAFLVRKRGIEGNYIVLKDSSRSLVKGTLDGRES